MLVLRRSLAAAATRAACRQLPLARVAARSIRANRYTTTTPRLLNAFHSQLEDPTTAQVLSSLKTPTPGQTPQTLTEKIVQRYSVGLAPGKKVKAGDYVNILPQHCMTHDNSWPVALKFMSIGASKIHDNKQVVMTLDHDVQNKSETNLKKYKQIEAFAQQHGVDFFGAGRGIGHQIMVEEGYAWPGTVTVASDSHSNIDDVLNHAIEFTGSEQTMRSIPIDDRLTIANMTTEWGALTGLFPIDSTLQSWLRARATTAAMFNPDSGSGKRFTHERIDELLENPLRADPGATYAKSLYLNLSTLSPFVSGPNSVKVATPLKDLESQDIKLHKAYLVSCTNSRASDLAAAARVFREAAKDGAKPKIADGLKFYIAAASIPEQQIAEEAGDWQVLLDAGAIQLPAGCGPCIGLGTGLLEPGENGISASNRNFKGRMGSTEAKAYLASPEVVAASALQGKIAGPGWYQKPEGVEKVIIGEGNGDVQVDKAISIEDALDKLIAEAESMISVAEKEFSGDNETAAPADSAAAEGGEESLTEIYPGFPEKVEGEIVFCDADNINTDGIYPGKYTYQDNVSIEKMAEVCMENYDTEFGKIAREGDILVSGFNFGCGSSREQAATAILAKKIPLVVAGSFGNIFSRNSINNALMGVEVPKLVQRLRESFGKDGKKAATVRTGWKFLWDLKRSKVTVTEGEGGQTWSQKVGELPPNVQEIIALGGLEKWVKSKIEA
ncbi:hypothetical protein VSDG_06578 [Cytospora chrysosperma]|uniref:Homoaconitase, mitochondrial n=1 Tax=Cytospora chrysosperma TaxID=252740 RepID=A0A423VNV1_CYTCH|nr:hypothetical protein VSDG_06578 [Valsa sordida]